MKLEEISKMTIDEINAELEKLNLKEDNFIDDKNEIKIHEEICVDEIIFLKNLQERLDVLFKGLREINLEDLDKKLNLTLNFLEFVLANVENRLQSLSKNK